MPIKKVVIAAAGQGTRMKHLSKNKSKHLINVCQKPFLAYLLHNLLKAGYQEMILVVGFRCDLMEDFLKEYNFKAEVVNQFEILGPKEKEYGTLCPLKCVRDIVGQENFLAVYGDFRLFSFKIHGACGAAWRAGMVLSYRAENQTVPRARPPRRAEPWPTGPRNRTVRLCA